MRSLLWTIYALSAGCLGDEAYGFRIIDAAQLILVIEVVDRAVMLDLQSFRQVHDPCSQNFGEQFRIKGANGSQCTRKCSRHGSVATFNLPT